MTELPVVVVSPHLDDAVLGCGQLLHRRPGSTVVTVFAGMPHRWTRTPYDDGCGFESSAQAVRSRRDEDRTACGLLGATPIHLDHLDGQYRSRPVPCTRIAVDLRDSVVEGDDEPAVFAPLGVNHADHDAVCDAALRAGFRDLWLYEELPNRVLFPEAAAARVAALTCRGVKLEATTRVVGDVTVKQQAVRCYQSQVHDKGDLGNEHAYLVPERYWRVVR